VAWSVPSLVASRLMGSGWLHGLSGLSRVFASIGEVASGWSLPARHVDRHSCHWHDHDYLGRLLMVVDWECVAHLMPGYSPDKWPLKTAPHVFYPAEMESWYPAGRVYKCKWTRWRLTREWTKSMWRSWDKVEIVDARGPHARPKRREDVTYLSGGC
jgi:hypothetical protein